MTFNLYNITDKEPATPIRMIVVSQTRFVAYAEIFRSLEKKLHIDHFRIKHNRRQDKHLKVNTSRVWIVGMSSLFK